MKLGNRHFVTPSPESEKDPSNLSSSGATRRSTHYRNADTVCTALKRVGTRDRSRISHRQRTQRSPPWV